MIDEATGICINCAKNEELKKYLQTCFLDNSECLICGEKESSIDIEEDKKFIALLKALIRLHYNELQYNHHWGGDKLYIILEKDNPILNHHYLSPENLDFLVGLIEEDSYSKPKYGIPLYMGFDSDNNRRFFGLTLQEEVSSIISEYENRLKIENQFKIEGEAFTLIKKFESDITNYLDIKKDLYRARIGYEKKIFNYDIEPISLISPEEG
ncbi:hypothetical protein, partial [Bacillus hominis]|uniref:hypothetical protein n=1 Tax=Bacillus hominis TaxID=2817478 RepID=UPI001BB3C844